MESKCKLEIPDFFTEEWYAEQKEKGGSKMKHIAFDPSGNFKEGQGTTGVCISVDGKQTELREIKAEDYDSADQYWMAHVILIQQEFPDHITIEGYKLYNHKGQTANLQANSELETPQLIGVLKHWCYSLDIPYNIQFASEVKTRWSEDVLFKSGILTKKGPFYYWNGQKTSTHKRDALKHSCHFWRYKYES
jgi:hypothetical protein